MKSNLECADLPLSYFAKSICVFATFCSALLAISAASEPMFAKWQTRGKTEVSPSTQTPGSVGSSEKKQSQDQTQSPATPAAESELRPNPNPEQQLWYGVIETPLTHLRSVLKIQGTGEKMSGSLTSLDQGDDEFPLSKVSLEDNQFRFECPVLGASYQGTVDPSGKVCEGNFSQNGRFRLKLTQVPMLPPTAPRQIWRGLLVAGPRQLNLQFRVFAAPDGQDHVVFDSLDEKVLGLPAIQSIDGQQVIFESSAIQAKFVGQMNPEKNSIAGSWSQGGVEFPLTFAAATEWKVTPPKRPQTPQPPFDYQITELKFPGGGPNVILAGTLTHPTITEEKSVFPAVVLVSGSGPQDRDETLFEHRWFAVLADDLTRAGFAVLRYDDRGVGQSTGNFAQGTTQDFAADAAAAIDFLKTQPMIRHEKMGIIGHSEGGLIAPILAMQKPQDIAFIVLLAGPGVSGAEIVRNQTRLMGQANGASPEMLEANAQINEIILETIATVPPDTASWRVINTLADACYEKLTPDLRDAVFDKTSEEGKSRSGQLNPVYQASLQTAASPWYRYFVNYDPKATLQQVDCPILALNGGKDLQVALELNQTAMEAAMAAVNKSNLEYRSFANLNHLFQNCNTGSPQEYPQIEESIAPEVLETIRVWLKQQIEK